MPQNQAQAPETLPVFEEQKIIFVSGKGGVGKSLIAAGIALDLAKAGRRTLLVEIGDNSYFKDFFALPAVGHQPVSTAFQFDLALWSGESCLREYVLHFLKLQRLYHIFFENKVMRALINVAPGLSEIAILGKITSAVRKVGPALPYDVVVVDCYATGHAMALFNAPRGMREAIGVGPVGAQSREMESVLRNAELCSYVLVTLLEEMPVAETLEFYQQLKSTLGVRPWLVANKVLRLPVDGVQLSQLVSTDPKGLGEFAEYLGAIFSRQQDYLRQLREADDRVSEIPLIFSSDDKSLVIAVGEALRRV